MAVEYLGKVCCGVLPQHTLPQRGISQDRPAMITSAGKKKKAMVAEAWKLTVLYHYKTVLRAQVGI